MASVNQIVTENILKMIASGEILSWEQAFIRTKRNVNSKKNYSMLNQLMLSGDRSELFITPKKAGEIGLDFTGVKTRIVTFWGTVDKIVDGEKKKIWFLRYYRVFGLDQCPESEVKTKLMEKSGVYKNHTPLNEIDALIKKIGALLLYFLTAVNKDESLASYFSSSFGITLSSLFAASAIKLFCMTCIRSFPPTVIVITSASSKAS